MTKAETDLPMAALWPSIAASESFLSPQTYIDLQLECLKERAETATQAKDPLIKVLASIQAYCLGNALYVTFPKQKELYATEVQQLVKPLFFSNK